MQYERLKINVAAAEEYIAGLSKDEQYKKARLDEILTRTSARPYKLPWRSNDEEVEISTHPHYFNRETLKLPIVCVTVDREATAAYAEENPEPPDTPELLDAMRVILAHLKDKTAGDRRLGESMATLQRAVDDGSWIVYVP